MRKNHPYLRHIEYEEVTSIEVSKAENIDVFNLGVNIDNSYQANGIFVHNCIHEISYAYVNGFLATLQPGQWVIGISMPDRCETCGALIDGKVYYYTAETNESMKYTDLSKDSKEYKRRAWLSENTVWLYKDNYGLSPAKKKRTEAGMVERENHELSKPCVPQHPNCRCTWNRFNPGYQFVDRDGTVKMRGMNEKAWKEFREKKIDPIKWQLKEFGIEVK